MMSETLVFPRRGRGRPSEAANGKYDREVAAFCAAVLEIKSRLDFKVSSRGWCYILEEHGIGKGDFDAAQKLINEARKSSRLPLDICAEDEARLPTFFEEVIDETPEEFANGWIDALDDAYRGYTPVAFWDYQDHYVEMLVEKIDLKTLFSPICSQFRVPIANARGWSDINGRANFMRRFKRWEDKGKQCVLLYCGDHDPAGLSISDTLMSLFEEMARAVGWNPSRLIVDRFGLNAAFINANGLTWIDGLETSSGTDLVDRSHPDHNKPYVQNYIRRFGARKVEANALVVRPEQGRDLCRGAILKYIDESAVEAYRIDIEAMREEARRAIAERMAP